MYIRVHLTSLYFPYRRLVQRHQSSLWSILDIVPVSVNIRHYLVDPDLFELLFIVSAGFLVCYIAIDLVMLSKSFRVIKILGLL